MSYWKCLPWYENSSSVQHFSMISIASSVIEPRNLRSMLNVANSSRRYPTAGPKMKRPLLRMSTTAQSSASRIGSWNGMRRMFVPMLTFVVIAAMAAAIGSIEGK